MTPIRPEVVRERVAELRRLFDTGTAEPSAESASWIPGGYVYMIGAAGSPLVKIGHSLDIARRLNTIQTMNPAPLKVLWFTAGSVKLESFLHRKFAAYRKHGEWFDLCTEDPVSLVRDAAQQLHVAA